MMILFKLLLLIIVANSAPIVAQKIFGSRFSYPLDGGLKFPDGKPLLGPSKTLRGVLLSVAATALAAPLLGFSWTIGVLIAAFAMLGDWTSSFIKRRFNRPPSSAAPALDQIPECLFPLLAVQGQLGLTRWDLVVVVVAFALLHMLLSPVLFKLHIRDQPH